MLQEQRPMEIFLPFLCFCLFLKDNVVDLCFITAKMELWNGISHQEKDYPTSEEHSVWMGSLPCYSGLCRDTGPEKSDAVGPSLCFTKVQLLCFFPAVMGNCMC